MGSDNELVSRTWMPCFGFKLFSRSSSSVDTHLYTGCAFKTVEIRHSVCRALNDSVLF